jgi:hypothetical protein
MMKIRSLLLIAAFLCVCRLFADSNERIAAVFVEKVDKYYKESDTAYRIRIAAIYPSVTIDPPLELRNFLIRSNFTLLLDAPSCVVYARNLQSLVRSSRWRPTERGVPTWYWSIIDADGVSHWDVLVDYAGSKIKIQEQWYLIDKPLLEALTKDIVELGQQKLQLNLTRQL